MRIPDLLRRTRQLLRETKARLAPPPLPPGADPRTLPLFEWGRRYLPHYLTKPPSRLHLELCADLDRARPRRGSRLARLAPRGSAKSTWATLAYPLRCAVEGTEPFALILSDTADQAGQFVAGLKAELEDNPRLAADYPDACGVGPEWRVGRVRLRNGSVVEGLSKGGRIRGRKNKQDRPSLVVVDDCQGNRDIVSPTERRRAWDWLTREVIPAGTEGHTTFLSVGTALHREAVAVRLLTTPGWEGKVYRSVEAWPDRADLWLEWERLLTNLADPDRDATAEAFYAANRAEMDRGAAVLWPAGRGLYALMRRRAEIGPGAFDTEDQGNPQTSEGAEWPAGYFDRPGFWFDRWPADRVRCVVSLDPSKGRADRPGDFQAHVVLVLSKDGTLWADCECRREPVPEMVARSVALAREYRPHCLAVETNQGLDLLVPEYERHAARNHLVVPLQAVEHYGESKGTRVRRLGAYLSRNQLRIRNTPGGRMLVDQLRDFPLGAHDDAPDALELAVRRMEILTCGK